MLNLEEHDIYTMPKTALEAVRVSAQEEMDDLIDQCRIDLKSEEVAYKEKKVRIYDLMKFLRKIDKIPTVKHYERAKNNLEGFLNG